MLQSRRSVVPFGHTTTADPRASGARGAAVVSVHDTAALAPELTSALDAMSEVVFEPGGTARVFDLVASLARSSVPRADEASVTLLRGGDLETPSATSDEVRKADERQYQTGEGPCVAAVRDRHRHNVALGLERANWPRFVAAATQAGLRSVLSTPMLAGERTLGALNLYSTACTPFDAKSVTAAQTFADRASVVLANATSFAAAESDNRHLQTALDTARVIGRAQGILMARENCTSDEAFDVLRRASQRSNRKLRDIAEEMIVSLDRRPRTEA